MPKLLTKVNKRAADDTPILTETRIVGEDESGQVWLNEIPLAAYGVSVTTPVGLTEVSSAPAVGEYRVTYSGRGASRVEFNAADPAVADGTEVTFGYKGTGSPRNAHDLNRLNDWLGQYYGVALEQYGTIANAVTEIGSDPVWLVVAEAVTVSADLVIPVNIRLRVISTLGSITIAPGATLNVENPDIDAAGQAFVCQADSGGVLADGAVRFGFKRPDNGEYIREACQVRAHWFGFRTSVWGEDATPLYISNAAALKAACFSLPQSGGDVLVDAGIYAISNCSVAKGNISIIGTEGRRSTVFYHGATTGYCIEWPDQYASYNVLKNIRFYGPTEAYGTLDTGSAQAIRMLAGTENNVLENVWVIGFHTGLYTEGSIMGSLKGDCLFEKVTIGWDIAGGQCNGWEAESIRHMDPNGPLANRYAMRCLTGLSNAEIFFRQASGRIHIAPASGDLVNVFLKARVTESSGAGIHVDGTNCSVKYNVVLDGSTVEECVGGGVSCLYVEGLSIQGVRVRNIGTGGGTSVGISAINCSDPVIKGCAVIDAQAVKTLAHGYLLQGCHNPTFGSDNLSSGHLTSQLLCGAFTGKVDVKLVGTYAADINLASHYWNVGTRLEYAAPIAGGKIGMVCTTAGYIGSGAVFKEFAPIDA